MATQHESRTHGHPQIAGDGDHAADHVGDLAHGDHDQSDHDHGHDDHGHDDHGHDDHGHAGIHQDHEHGHGGPLGFLTGFFRPHSHDAADSVDDALEGSAEGIRAVKISLVGLGVTAVLQLVIVYFSGSVALLADTIHNFADASTAIPLWIAFSVGRWPATRRYTYGYGRAEDLAGVFIVLMIAGSAAVAGWESVWKLMDPQPMGYVGWVAAAGVVGFLGNELVAQYRIRTGERIGSAALVADGYHARTDGLTSLAVLAAAGGAWLGYPIVDPLIGLVITVAILFVLKDAVVQVWRRLMDAIEPDLLERAEAAAAGTSGVLGVSEIRARWLGHSIVAETRIVADADVSLAQAHDIAEAVRHAMLHAVPKLANVIVHVDPSGFGDDAAHEDLRHHDGPTRKQAHQSALPKPHG